MTIHDGFFIFEIFPVYIALITELIESDSQILSTSGYIHLNPVRANMVKKPEDYAWSSHSLIIELRNEKLIENVSENILTKTL